MDAPCVTSIRLIDLLVLSVDLLAEESLVGQII
jgi:hypothetical protein